MSTGADDDEGEGERPLSVTTPNATNAEVVPERLRNTLLSLISFS
jgi:hypothetical protein